MNLEEFKELVGKDPHSLAKQIREGKIPFSDVSSFIEEATTPPLIKFAYLVHPDCTIKEFTKYYRPVVKKSGDLAYRAILSKTPLVKHLSIIAHVLHAESSGLEDIKSGYQLRQKTFLIIAKNPHCNVDFKNLVYELTDDVDLLPQAAQDIFIF